MAHKTCYPGNILNKSFKLLLVPSLRGGNAAAAAAAAAMAAATNKFLQQQSHQHQISIEGNGSTIASPLSPSFSSTRAKSNESDKSTSAVQTTATTPPSSMESCGGDEPTYPTKATPSEANGSISNDIESNCSTANSND